MDSVTADLVQEMVAGSAAWLQYIDRERTRTSLGPVKIGGRFFCRCDYELLVTAGIEAQRILTERKAKALLDVDSFAAARQSIREAAEIEIDKLTERPSCSQGWDCKGRP